MDSGTAMIGREPPGAPVPGGSWEIACRLVRQYEFAEPRILHAVYRPDDDLLGQDMLIEQGRLSYEVIKNATTGTVSFRVAGYSRRAPIPDPLVRWGFRLFGRWTRQRFYRNVLLARAWLHPGR